MKEILLGVLGILSCLAICSGFVVMNMGETQKNLGLFCLGIALLVAGLIPVCVKIVYDNFIHHR